MPTRLYGEILDEGGGEEINGFGDEAELLNLDNPNPNHNPKPFATIEELPDISKGNTFLSSRSRVLLRQGHDDLNLEGNFTSNVFESAMDEITGLLTTTTVYMAFDEGIFLAAVGVYAFNIFVRLLIGLHELFFLEKGQQWKRTEEGALPNGLWLRVVGGLFLIMLEPVSGIALINSAIEAEPALSKDEQEIIKKARHASADVDKTLSELKKEKKERKQELTRFKLNDLNSFQTHTIFFTPEEQKELEEANENASATLRSYLDKEVLAKDFEIKYLQKEVPLKKKVSDFVDLQADQTKSDRVYTLERKALKGTEMVEMVMAAGEDIPEIILGIVFAAKGGLDQSTDADISLFVTSMAISLFHAGKCFWAYTRLRSVIQKSKNPKRGMRTLKTFDGFFTIPAENPQVEPVFLDFFNGSIKNIRETLKVEKRKLGDAQKDAQNELDKLSIDPTPKMEKVLQKIFEKNAKFKERLEKGKVDARKEADERAQRTALSAGKPQDQPQDEFSSASNHDSNALFGQFAGDSIGGFNTEINRVDDATKSANLWNPISEKYEAVQDQPEDEFSPGEFADDAANMSPEFILAYDEWQTTYHAGSSAQRALLRHRVRPAPPYNIAEEEINAARTLLRRTRRARSASRSFDKKLATYHAFRLLPVVAEAVIAQKEWDESKVRWASLPGSNLGSIPVDFYKDMEDENAKYEAELNEEV